VQDVYSRNDTKVYVVACDTGVGKTEAFLSLPLRNTYVGFPTHQLKDEALERAFNKAMNNVFVWPKRPRLPEPYESTLLHLESIDLNGTMSVLQRAAEALNGGAGDACREYLQAIIAVQTAPLIFGTHDKAFSLRNPNIRTFIIDEDFSSKVFDFSTVNQQDVSFLLSMISGREDDTSGQITGFLRQVDHASSREPTINTAGVNYEAWSELIQHYHSALASPVIRLASCDAFMRSVSGQIIAVAKRGLHPDAKYIIFSATADEAIYRALVGDRLEFIDLRGTQRAGRIHLHRRNSYSKNCIEWIGQLRFKTSVVKDQNQWQFDGIITHKEYVSERNGRHYLLDTNIEVFAWFGNLEGFDSFKGKSIAVYGVPHLPEEVYRLFAFLLTGKYDESYCRAFTENLITRNEWEFTLMSPPDNFMQGIQLHAIESQLIQAAGRSRYVTEACDVHLFGNFPLAYCNLVD
jgi:hypothetical protein